MRKTLTTALILIFIAVPMLPAHHGPEKLTLKAAMTKQGPVAFSHAKHAKLIKTCDTCHHDQKGLTAEKATPATKVPTCTSCHLNPKAGVPSMKAMNHPFHNLCVGCHKKGKKGPTTCTGCHAKK